jgi:hypothetical protein
LVNLKRPLEGHLSRWKNNIGINMNPLKKKGRFLDLKTQFLQRSKQLISL